MICCWTYTICNSTACDLVYSAVFFVNLCSWICPIFYILLFEVASPMWLPILYVSVQNDIFNHFSRFFSRISLIEFNLVMLIYVLKLFPCSFYRPLYEIDTGCQKQCSPGSDTAVTLMTSYECDLWKHSSSEQLVAGWKYSTCVHIPFKVH